MTDYLEKLDRHLAHIESMAESEPDPHRSRILWNYLHHGALELSGNWERIFDPSMTVDHPHYEMRTGSDETVVLDGTDEVKEFYAIIEDENVMAINDGLHQLFVNDDGLAEFASTVDFAPGHAIADERDAWYYDDPVIDDPDATYARVSPHAMYWPYTDDGRLVGERVYQIEPFTVEKVDPDAAPTVDDIAAVAEAYFPENVDGDTPYADL